MHKLMYVMPGLLLSSCGQPRREQPASVTAATPVVKTMVVKTAATRDTAVPAAVTEQPAGTSDPSEIVFDEYQTFHLVTVAEGYDYDSLRRVAVAVASQLGTRIDSLGRMYDPRKGIVLPPNDADELYRGEYYPRRFATPTVSIEMKYAYVAQSDTMRMLLVAGIFEEHQQADSVLALVKPLHPNAGVIDRELFIGCMH